MSRADFVSSVYFEVSISVFLGSASRSAGLTFLVGDHCCKAQLIRVVLGSREPEAAKRAEKILCKHDIRDLPLL